MINSIEIKSGSLSTEEKPLAVSVGEPAGIGADLILQLYQARGAHALPPFLVYGNLDFLKLRAQRLGLDIQVARSDHAGAASLFGESLPVFDLGERVKDTPGKSNKAGGEMVLQAIERATTDCLSGACRGLVTAPINKAAVQDIGFAFPGHTEFLAHLCVADGRVPTPVMMLADGELRVVPLTIHVALSAVPSMVTKQKIVDHVKIIARDLRKRFGIKNPKVAITGLNPHAGENGAFGQEDLREIVPAIAMLQDIGIEASGPYPADTAFHLPNWRQFDIVLAMYHDQALIPIKTVAFDSAVNVTLGLPIIRTSPDHGTAYDLAGSGKASVKSMLAAIKLADRMADTTQLGSQK